MSNANIDIAGNGSDKVKAVLKDVPKLFLNGRPNIFAASIIKKLVLAQVSIKSNVIEPQRKEGLVVYNVTVEEDMVNGGGTLHGGCSAFLIDLCSTASIMALKIDQGVSARDVSQSMSIVYHAPAAVGETLRIVNTTMAVGRRVASARTEIWSETHHRLVASGVHIKMEPSSTKL
ncbi:HotDog domain-containing protein [Lentinula raphanica]|nr:HotDog domain-containing protein [Lentinula raphanica]KAJ3968466.1 HotDog domain-containing protein [Lentinula raphanica]